MIIISPTATTEEVMDMVTVVVLDDSLLNIIIHLCPQLFLLHYRCVSSSSSSSAASSSTALSLRVAVNYFVSTSRYTIIRNSPNGAFIAIAAITIH